MSNEVTVKPVESIKTMLRDTAAEVGDKTAYRFARGEEIVDVSFREFREETLALGEALWELGVTGEHIAITAPNSYDWITVYLTVLQSKGVFVPIDKDLPDEDFMNVLLDSDTTVLFYTEKHKAVLEKNAERLGHIRYFIGIDVEEEDARHLSYRRLLAHGHELRNAGSAVFEEETRDPSLMKMLVYTSGTTGLAKGVMLTEHNLCSGVYYGLQVCTTIGDVGLSVLPYHHTYEAIPGILVAIHCHNTLCLNENLRTVKKNLVRYKPTFVYLVPAFVEVFYKNIWASIEKQGKTKAFKLLMKFSNGLRKIGIDRRRKLFAPVLEAFGGELRQIVCGGAPLRPELGKFFDTIGISLYNGYGITECSPLVSVNTHANNDCHTVGMPLPCCEIRLADVTPEGDGELCVRGDVVMLGYYKNPEGTAEVMEPDGWFHTGDYGRLTEKGQIIITGRKKNLIVMSNGKNIFPEEQENYIQQIPYVEEVVVFGIRDSHGQEDALGAEVFLNAEVAEKMGIAADPLPRLKEDIDRVLAHLPVYKHIAKIYVRDIPFVKTTTNKIRRNSLIHKD